MLLDCEGEEHIHNYSPKDMEHHLNTKHTSFFEQIVAEHDKVRVCLEENINLFGDDDKCKDELVKEYTVEKVLDHRFNRRVHLLLFLNYILPNILNIITSILQSKILSFLI